MAGYDFSDSEVSVLHAIVDAYLLNSDSRDWSYDEYERGVRSYIHDGATFQHAMKRAFKDAMIRLVKEDPKELDEEVAKVQAIIDNMKKGKADYFDKIKEYANENYYEKLLG